MSPPEARRSRRGPNGCGQPAQADARRRAGRRGAIAAPAGPVPAPAATAPMTQRGGSRPHRGHLDRCAGLSRQVAADRESPNPPPNAAVDVARLGALTERSRPRRPRAAVGTLTWGPGVAADELERGRRALRPMTPCCGQGCAGSRPSLAGADRLGRRARAPRRIPAGGRAPEALVLPDDGVRRSRASSPGWRDDQVRRPHGFSGGDELGAAPQAAHRPRADARRDGRVLLCETAVQARLGAARRDRRARRVAAARARSERCARSSARLGRWAGCWSWTGCRPTSAGTTPSR